MTAWAFPKPAKREKAPRKRLGPSTYAAALSAVRARETKPRAQLRRTWMKAEAPRRRKRERVFTPFVAWLFAEGATCVVCGRSRGLQGSHVAPSLGTGAKHGLACDMVRMCGPRYRWIGCHGEFDQRKGRFLGWSEVEREEASRTWRLLHWSAFSAWVGIAVARRDIDPVEAAALVACEEAIAAHRARVFGARGEVAA